MIKNQNETNFLKAQINWVYGPAVLMLVLTAAASMIGLINPEWFYPTEAFRLAFIPNDMVNLAFGIPLILVSVWLTSRKKLIGYLTLPGAMYYILYSYVNYLLPLPFNALFPVYIGLVALPIYLTIGFLTRMDGVAVQQQLEGKVPVRFAAGVLIFLAVFILLRQFGLIGSALIHQKSFAVMEMALFINDLVVICPALLVGGFALWQKKPFGYLVGPGLLVQYGLLAFSVVPVLIYQAAIYQQPVDWGGLITVSIMGLLCLIPYGFFAWGAKQN